jgi:hypothetical protein
VSAICKHRGGRIGQTHECDDVDLDHVFHHIEVGIHHRGERADPGIVHQHGQASVLLQRGFDARDILMLAKIGYEDFNRTAGVITDPGSQRVETIPVACDDGQIVAAARQPFRISSADPTRCSGDQGPARILKRHSSLPESDSETLNIYAWSSSRGMS